VKILIDYIEEREVAHIYCADAYEPEWDNVSRIVYDSIPGSIFIGLAIYVPWRLFLSNRIELFTAIKESFASEISLSDKCRLMLVSASSTLYQAAIRNLPISEVELVRVLESKGFVRKLTKEQIRNICKMVSIPAVATFSVPGAGKTTEALAYFFFHSQLSDRLLVVAPKNAFAAWDEQIEACTGINNDFARLRGGYESIRLLLQRKPKYAIISYQQFPNVVSTLRDYLKANNVFMYLDESHRIKGGDGKTIAESILSVNYLPIRKVIMTGTPMPQSISDLDPQARFLYPELSINEHNAKELFAPIYVRTTKGELHLPPVTRRAIPIEMSPQQYTFYKLLCSEVARELSSLPRHSRKMIRTIGKSIIKVLQYVSNPALLCNDIRYISSPELFEILKDTTSPKIEYACRRARELASINKKTIIWSSYVSNVELISSRLSDIGADYIHGKIDAGDEDDIDTREGKIKRFHNDDHAMVLVANPAAASEGISLHKICHNAIYVDRSFNAAQYLQSEDRIHRLGLASGTETVVEILECSGTIDEVVSSRLREKVSRMSAILNDQSLNIDAIPYEYEDDDNDGVELADIDGIKKHLSGFTNA